MLSARQASKLIHATDRPSEQQVMWVERQLKTGKIVGVRSKKANAPWTTTATAIAQYMAEVNLPDPAATANSQAAPRGSAELGDVYRDVLKDYFLAMIFRRGQRARSKLFGRAVAVGQVLTLLTIVAMTVSAISPLLAAAPPEHTAIETWIGENTGRFDIVRYHPGNPTPEGQGEQIRVEYRYSNPGGKVVKTERVFTVVGGRVVGVESF